MQPGLAQVEFAIQPFFAKRRSSILEGRRALADEALVG